MSDIVQIIVTEQPIQVIPTNFMPIATAATASVAVSASYANVASVATSASFATTASYAANVPATASFAISSSFAITASYAANVPATASFAISASQATNANNSISSSFATTASYASNVPLTSSYAISASHALNSDNAISASNVLYNNIGQKPSLFSGSSQVQLDQITGTTFANADFTFPANVNVLGTATVRQLYTQYETSSIIFASGSTKFGDTADDTHQFTGSLTVLGTISGALILPGDIVSSSSQVKSLLPTDTVSSSVQVLAFLPTGVVSSSSQITAILPDGVMSSSAQTVANVAGQTIAPAAINATGIISASRIITSNSSSIAGVDIGTGAASSSANIAIGQNALSRIQNTTANTGSIAIGQNAFGNNNGSATSFNVIIGHQAFGSGSGNVVNTVAIGAFSMVSASTNQVNTAVGVRTLQSASFGQNFNTALGGNVLQSMAIGIQNTGVGSAAFGALVSGSSNTAVGRSSMAQLRSGSDNITIGVSALSQTLTGSFNVAIGNNALSAILSGSNNIAIGNRAGTNATSASNELFIDSLGTSRTGLAGVQSGSIIYGRMSEVASGQVLRLNAMVVAPYGITGSIETASFATTASFVNGIVASASYASTASIAENVSGFISFPNGLFVTGSVSASVFSGSGAGLTDVSAVTATSASFATTASAATSITFTPLTASFATTASAATSITFTPSTASFATTASFALNAGGGGITFPYSGDAVITGSLRVSGSGVTGAPTASTTAIDLNGILWSGSYNNSSIIPGAVSASDLGSQSNPFRNAYFSGFISASAVVGFSGSAGPPPAVTSASFTYDASSATPVTGTTGSVAGIHDQIKACIVSSSGTRLYYLNPTNWAQKEDTTASTLNGAGQHVMIEIPKMYWKASQTGTGTSRTVTYQISMDAASTGSSYNFQLHPAFYKSGSVVDYRYVSAYMACGRNGSTTYSGNTALDTGSAANQLASISGSAPLNARSKTSYRQLANNIGNGWGIHEIYLQNAIELLYLTEYKDLNTQAKLGNGNGSTAAVAGGSNAYANGSTPAGYVGSVRYRGIENLWGVASQWVDGIVLSPTPITAYVTNDHRYFGDYPNSTALANYVKISGSMDTIAGGGYFGDYYEYNSHQLPLILPTTTGGSSTTKFCDFGYYVSNSPSGSYSIGANGSAAGQIGLWYREIEAPTRADQYYSTRITY